MDLNAFGIGDSRNLATIEAVWLVLLPNRGRHWRRRNINSQLVHPKWNCSICWVQNTYGCRRLGRLCCKAAQETQR